MREILAEKVNVCHSLEASNKKLHWNNIFLETHFSLSLFNVGEFAQQRHESDCSHVEFERDEAHNLAEKALNSFVCKFSFFCICKFERFSFGGSQRFKFESRLADSLKEFRLFLFLNFAISPFEIQIAHNVRRSKAPFPRLFTFDHCRLSSPSSDAEVQLDFLVR